MAVTATNLATGEQSELGIPAPKTRRHTIVGYYSLAPGAAVRLKASPLEWAIIHVLLERQDSRNNGSSAVTQRELSDLLGRHVNYVQQAMSRLQKRDIVHREGVGRYRVNSHIGFQGSRAAWEYAWVGDRDPDWTGTRPKLKAL